MQLTITLTPKELASVKRTQELLNKALWSQAEHAEYLSLRDPLRAALQSKVAIAVEEQQLDQSENQPQTQS